ncbi:MAG: hypothetical protein Q8Q46_03690 [Candidatus Giovannonibacteria bacterium]|nr:hypothetical protein [Candidatus Giovannonibacteria bacterium]
MVKQCPTHGEWSTITSTKLYKDFGITTIFYCARAGCGEFEFLRKNESDDSQLSATIRIAVLTKILLTKEKRRILRK